MKGFENYTWLNAPASSEIRSGDLWVKTGDRTDFWRGTFYDFWRDSGHFAYVTVEGDFSAEVTVDGLYEALYDQAGLMVRLSESHWIKAGTEFTDGEVCLSVVVTNDHSDWSVQRMALPSDGLRLRLTRHGEAIKVQYLRELDQKWQLIRLAYLPPTTKAEVGVMCCSPERNGFEVLFRDFQIGPAIDRRLHD
ncbi:hypothetical protein LMG27952_07068 [Paraburkholderia hiiakae]|uniref:DUF1349 domain-containing protein n=1 Tax=Paraburkholderia hiiakae TaxID=1081782 RepID=A0ABM8P9W9_9BURK|nr:DUF1349 domain-containing protein [Paraburkholderia hiiakae]CAD6560199.1 hypothetical protein LMG27952_07068 [Paraburkholderia hiiakae]